VATKEILGMSEYSEQINGYLNEMKDIPLLTLEDEIKLSKIIRERLALLETISDPVERQKAEKSDKILENAINSLVTPNLRLCIKEALDLYKKTKTSVKDLVGYGNLGLIRAAYRYEAEKYNTKFSTYATYWIRMEMYKYINSCHVVTIPFNVLELRQKYNKMVGEENKVSDSQIMQELDVTSKKLQKAKDANVSSVYMSYIVSGDNGDGNPLTVGDLIADENESPSDTIERQDEYALLMEAMSQLDPMSREIICAQMLDPNKVNLSDLGKRFNLSAEAIRLTRDKALKKLKSILVKKAKQRIN
jgi:RNA polymerase primary sigma factor